MPSSALSFIGRVLRRSWWLLDAGRRAVLNLVFLVLLLALVGGTVWALKRGPAALQPKTALVLDLSGRISEQRSGSVRESAIKRARGENDEGQTLLRDVLDVLDTAAKDEKITHAVLMLDGLSSAGLPTLREVAAAIDRFKAAGKPVFAWGSSYDQHQYFLAAHASEVWLHPMGAVEVEGYGRYRSYYKDLFDKVGVSANVIRAGRFKNAAESFSSSEPSKETLESDGALYASLWSTWTGGVEQARKQPAGSVMRAIDSLPDSLLAAGGDFARWAFERKWVDALKTPDEMRAALIERGAASDDKKTFRQVSFGAYLARVKRPHGGDAVGVVVAEGSIRDGQAGPGGIGGASTSELIRKAREDDKIKAIVLRVNSPGGSAFASELVRRELELTRKAGKPVVVSMGDVAASGGYWISLAADEMIADEATITGSIGVIAMLPTAQGTYAKLGVHTGGVTTTWLGEAYDVRRGIDPRFVQLLQASIDHTYRDFTGRVATARKTTPEKIDAVAQGRVWAGKDALALGLVDRLGSFGDALASAAGRAKLAPGWRVQYVEVGPGRLERLLQGLGVDLGGSIGADLGGAAQALTRGDAGLPSVLAALGWAAPPARQIAADIGWLAEIIEQHKPYAAVVHCLCTAP